MQERGDINMLRTFILFTAFSLTSSRHLHFYRKDYTFIEEFDAYYKLHWDTDGITWTTAFMACDNEGSKLFYPKEDGEWALVKNLTNLLLESPNTTDVIVGIHDEIGFGEFVTVDGGVTPTPILTDQPVPEGQECVIMDMETGEYKTAACLTEPPTIRMFVCKKIDEKHCRTIDLEYKYSKETKKCYKVNKRKRNWQDAWHTCYMEGSSLIVPENNAEADVIYTIIKDTASSFFSGFRRISPGGDFYTVRGQKLEDSGFQRGRSDFENKNNYNCGIVTGSYNQLSLRNRDCNEQLPFICEMSARA